MALSSSDLDEVRAHLRAGDRIVSAREVHGTGPRRLVPSLQALCTLGGVKTSRELGANGPPAAATTTGDSRSAPPELRLFEALFARDALWVAHFVGDYYPALRRATIVALAETQGVTANKAREEEPGRIVHEVRSAADPVARALSSQGGWGWPYYGAVDTTPLFVQCVSDAVSLEGGDVLRIPYVSKSGERRVIADALGDALEWLGRQQDRDPDGLISYMRAIPGGIENQFWRDSWDALSHDDGSIANQATPIAALHVQAVSYDALIRGARLAASFKLAVDSSSFIARAEALRRSVFRWFWVEEGAMSFPAAGLDYERERGRRRQLRIRTSDMGHLLATEILDEDGGEVGRWRDCIIRNLRAPTMLCDAGLRTLDSREARYWEGGYHTGSSWLWDTLLVAEGCRKHGFDGLGRELERRCWDVWRVTGTFPEFARGSGDGEVELTRRLVDVWQAADRRINRLEQPPQEIQAWSVAAVHAMKRRRGESLLATPLSSARSVRSKPI